MYYLYRITDTLNNKVYIGQSNKETERWRQHKYFARQEEPIQYIHRAIKKYGVDNFVYEVIATCQTQEGADEIEAQLIKQYDSYNNEKGYNIAHGGNHAWNAGLPKEQQPMYGKKQSAYFKQKMSEVHSGKTFVMTEETKNKISQSNMGREVSEETRNKISVKHMGKKYSDETIKKMSEWQKGRKLSKETKAKMSKARKGIYIGEKNPASKLTFDLANKIRNDYGTNKYTQPELSKKYDVSTWTIWSVVNNKTWKNFT